MIADLVSAGSALPACGWSVLCSLITQESSHLSLGSYCKGIHSIHEGVTLTAQGAPGTPPQHASMLGIIHQYMKFHKELMLQSLHRVKN